MFKLIKAYIHSGLRNQLFQYTVAYSIQALNPGYRIKYFFNDNLWSKKVLI